MERIIDLPESDKQAMGSEWTFILFERLPEARTPEAIDALLPQNLKAEDLKL